tara:strand:- start:546 stop:1559 length:1014 start_codon:yes stop_codon:yes gene_type:complete
MILFIGNFLTAHGYNPTFLEILGNELSEKYDIELVSSKKNKLFRLYDMFKYYIINLKKIKLLIIDTYSSNAFYYALLLAFFSILMNKKYILVLSGGGLGRRLDNSFLFNIILRKSYLNISPSKYLYKKFINYNIEYIPNYIDLEKYHFKKRKNLAPNLLWVRSLHEIYNPKMAVLVLKSLIKTYPKATLCLVGPAKDESLNEIQRLIKKYDLVKSIIVTGRLNKRDWIKLSIDYDIFINTTNYDNHPVSVIEVMALGLPVVTTNVGGIPYFLKNNETAKLVGKNDVVGMVLAIDEYINDSFNSIEIAMNARKLVSREYSKEIIFNKWCSIIDNLILS